MKKEQKGIRLCWLEGSALLRVFCFHFSVHFFSYKTHNTCAYTYIGAHSWDASTPHSCSQGVFTNLLFLLGENLTLYNSPGGENIVKCHLTILLIYFITIIFSKNCIPFIPFLNLQYCAWTIYYNVEEKTLKYVHKDPNGGINLLEVTYTVYSHENTK